MATKSEQRQKLNWHAGLESSSSEFSEDDTPLTMRLNSQENRQPNDCRKQFRQSVMAKKGKFVIPRKKKAANELLQVSSFGTREGKELLRNVMQSYRDPTVGATFRFEKLEFTFNDQLSREFQEKKQNFRNESRNPKELEDKHAFLYTTDRHEVQKICEMGLEVGSTSVSCLGDPSMGVYLCRHADVISRKPLAPGTSGFLIVFKVLKGKVKPVTERSGVALKDLLEPTPNFDCHISRSVQSLNPNSSHFQVFEYSQYYFYEFSDEGDDLHVKRPRQCLPYAVISFSVGDSVGLAQDPVVVEETVGVENHEFIGKGSTDKRRNRGSQVLWTGLLANKDRTLAKAKLVCHSQHKLKLPFDIGEKIVVKEKISFQQLRSLLTFPLFRAGPPSISRQCKVSLTGDASYVHCELQPVNDGHGKIRKLVKYFQERSWAGIVKCPDANRVIFLIPTSRITQDLGITKSDSPSSLHVLLFLKKEMALKGRENSQELNAINQIQTELKKQFAVKNSVDQKQIDQKLLVFEAASTSEFPTVNSGLDQPVASSLNNSGNDGPFFETALTLEQKKTWQNAVVDWLSRPCPLTTTVVEMGVSHGLRDTDTSTASVIRRRRSAEAVNIRSHLQDARLNVSSENYKLPPRKPVTGLQVVNKPGQSRHKDVLDGHGGRHSDNPEQVRSGDHMEHRVKEKNIMEFKSPGEGANTNTNTCNANSETTTPGIELEFQVVPTSKVATLSTASTASSLKYEVNVDDGVKKVVEEQMRFKQHGKYEVNVDDGVRNALQAKMKEQHVSRSKSEVLVEDPVEEAADKVQNQNNWSKCQSDVQDPNLSVKEGKTITKSVPKSHKTKETSVIRTTIAGVVTSSFRENKSGSSVKKQTAKDNTLASVIGEEWASLNKKREAEVTRPAAKSRNKRAKVSQIGKDENSVTTLKTSENCSQSVKPHMVDMEVPELSEDPLPAIQTTPLSCFQPSEKANQTCQKPKLKLILSTKRDTKKGSILAESDNKSNHTPDTESCSQTAQLHSQGDDHSKQMLVRGDTERRSTDSAVISEKIPVPSPSVSVLGSVSPITVVSSKGRYHSPVSPSVSAIAAVHSTPASLQSFSPPLPPAVPFIPPLPQGPFRSPILPDVTEGNIFSFIRPDHTLTMEPSHLMPCSPGISPPGPRIKSPPVAPAMLPGLPLNVHPIIPTPVVRSTPSPVGTYPGGPQSVAQVIHSPLPPPPLPPPPLPPAPLPPTPHSAILSRSNSTEAPSPTSSFQIPQLCHQWNLPPPPTVGALPMPDQLSFSHTQGTRFMTVERPRFPSPQQPFQPEVRFGYTQALGFAQSQGPYFMPSAVLYRPHGFPWAAEMPSLHHKPSPSSSQYQCTTPFCKSNFLGCESSKSYHAASVISTTSTPVSTIVSGTVPCFSESQRTFLRSNQQNSSYAWETSLPKNNVEAGKVGENQVSKDNSGASPNVSYAAVQIEEGKPMNRTEQLREDVNMLSLYVGHKLKAHVDTPAVSDQKMAEPVKEDNQSAGKIEINGDVGDKNTVVTGGEEKKAETVGGETSSLLELAPDSEKKLYSFLQTSNTATGEQDMDNVWNPEYRNISKLRVSTSTEQGNTGAPKHMVKNNMDCGTSDHTENLGHDMFDVLDSTELEEQQNIITGSCHEEQTKNSTTCIINSDNGVEDFPDVTYQPASPSVGIYLTEAEKKSSNAASRIYDILRCNAQKSSFEACWTDEEADVQKGRSKDVDSNSDVEGVAEEKAVQLNNREESTDSDGTSKIHLGSGLHVVKMVDLGHCDHEKQPSTLIPTEDTQDKKMSSKVAMSTPVDETSFKASRKKNVEAERGSEWEEISDASDQGTPERDLPDFTQAWPKVADTAYGDVTESVAPLKQLQQPAKPKPDIVCSEADSSCASPERVSSVKSYVKAPFLKRKVRLEKGWLGNESELSSLSKRRKANSHEKRAREDSPHKGVGSEKSTKADTVNNGSVESSELVRAGIPSTRSSNLPTRIVNADVKGRSLQITILQDKNTGNKDTELLETKGEENALADMKYSDLEDISPGGLTGDSSERPPTPDTPETAAPAADFTHPGLGFWAAPLNGKASTNSAETGDNFVTDVEGLVEAGSSISLVQSSEVAQPDLEIEEHRCTLDAEPQFDVDRLWIAEEPEDAKMSFFRQTTTSEERDYMYHSADHEKAAADLVMDEESLVIDTIADRYYSETSHGSDEDHPRSRREYKSEVYDYGHGATDREQPYRSNRQLEKNGHQRRKSTRVSRYPWKTREESNRSRLTSPGGEGPRSASQSDTGRNTGYNKPTLHEDSVTLENLFISQTSNDPHKRTASVTSSSSNSSDADQIRQWEISIFAWMSKSQLESWLEVKQHQGQGSSSGLEGPCTVLYSPESLRRSSERLFRRVKQRMKRPSLSSRKRIKLEGTRSCQGADVDNTEFENCPVKHDKEKFEEESCGLSSLTWKSENLTDEHKHKHDSKNTSSEHTVSRCTFSEENVLNKAVAIGNDNGDTLDAILQTNIVDDFICDKEVVNILQSGGMVKSTTYGIIEDKNDFKEIENAEKCLTSGTILEQKGGDNLSLMGQTTLVDNPVTHNKASDGAHSTIETVNQNKYDSGARDGQKEGPQQEEGRRQTGKERQPLADRGKRLEKKRHTNDGQNVEKYLCAGSRKSKPGEKPSGISLMKYGVRGAGKPQDFECRTSTASVATGKENYCEKNKPPVAASFVANNQCCAASPVSSQPVVTRFPKKDRLCPPGTELDSSGSVEFDLEGVFKSTRSKSSSVLLPTDIQREKAEPGQIQHQQEQSRDIAMAQTQSRDTTVGQDLLHQRIMDQSVVTAIMQFYSEIEEIDRTTEGDENNLKDKEDNFIETEKSNASETPESCKTKTGTGFGECSTVFEVESYDDSSDKVEMLGKLCSAPKRANCFEPQYRTEHENKTTVESLDKPSRNEIVTEDAWASSAADLTATTAASPIDAQFLAGAEDTIFSSIGSLRNLLGVSSTFDRIAEEAITSTVSSLESVLYQAHSRLNKANQEVAAPGKHVNLEHIEDRIESRDASLAAASGSTHLQSTHQGRSREELTNGTNNSSKVMRGPFIHQKIQKATSRKKFNFYVYSPEFDKECEAVKNYMMRAGGTVVDVKDTACLEDNLRVLIRRKHLPSVHRLANLYRLKMMPSVKFAVFNTLADVIEGRRSYENIFVSGGVLIADDTFLKTVEPEHLEALFRFMKEQSATHQKLVWVMDISRNGYKKLATNRPLKKNDSEVLNMVRRYRQDNLATVLPKGYVTESAPSIQRYLQASLKRQIELMTLYRHVVLLSDMDKRKMEVSWFVGRGIGVMNIREFLTTFAGEHQAKRLLESHTRGCGTSVKETCTLTDCSTPEDERTCQTPDGTPVSDFPDSPVVESCTLPQGGGSSPLSRLRNTTFDRSNSTDRFPAGLTTRDDKKVTRSLSWDEGTMTRTRLQILSCVRSVRDNIRCQVSGSTSSSPVNQSNSPHRTASPLFDTEARLRSQVLEGRGGTGEGPCVATSVPPGQDNLRMD